MISKAKEGKAAESTKEPNSTKEGKAAERQRSRIVRRKGGQLNSTKEK